MPWPKFFLPSAYAKQRLSYRYRAHNLPIRRAQRTEPQNRRSDPLLPSVAADGFASHAHAFATQFPDEAKQLQDLREQSALLKGMLLGPSTEVTPWTESDRHIAQLLDEALLDLDDAICDVFMGRLKPAMISMRCFLEQCFFAIYYSEQALDFTVWRRDPKHFVMLHQLYEDRHVFAKHFQAIFRERRDPEFPKGSGRPFSKRLFDELERLYSDLSASVHGRPNQREAEAAHPCENEIALFRKRLAVGLAIAAEFFDAAGTGEECPIRREFRFNLGTALK